MSRRLIGFALIALAGAALWWWFRPDPAPAAVAAICQPPPGAQLVIACSDACGAFNRRAIRRAASALDYDIELIDDLSAAPRRSLASLDGLILPGGADIDPALYSRGLGPAERRAIEALDHLVVYTAEGRRRDPYEAGLLQDYFADPDLATLPVLGICRGMQLLSVSQGLPLVVDVQAQLGIPARRYVFDEVSITTSDSAIARLMGGHDFRALALHHQALDLDYLERHRARTPDLRVTARSHGGRMAEVLEFDRRPVLGTQYHPELSSRKVRGPIFRWLLTQACEGRRTRHHPPGPGTRSRRQGHRRRRYGPRQAT